MGRSLKGKATETLLGLGDTWSRNISVTASATQTHDFNFPFYRTSILYVSIVASGTTDCDLSIHESSDCNRYDMVYRAVEISTNDTEPTGGRVSEGSLGYEERNENNRLHVKTVENSGIGGAVTLRLRHVEDD